MVDAKKDSNGFGHSQENIGSKGRFREEKLIIPQSIGTPRETGPLHERLL